MVGTLLMAVTLWHVIIIPSLAVNTEEALKLVYNLVRVAHKIFSHV